MSRLICTGCDAVFSDLEVVGVREPHGEVLGTCPYCGSYDIDNALECDECGETFDELVDGTDYCEQCFHALDAAGEFG